MVDPSVDVGAGGNLEREIVVSFLAADLSGNSYPQSHGIAVDWLGGCKDNHFEP